MERIRSKEEMDGEKERGPEEKKVILGKETGPPQGPSVGHVAACSSGRDQTDKPCEKDKPKFPVKEASVRVKIRPQTASTSAATKESSGGGRRRRGLGCDDDGLLDLEREDSDEFLAPTPSPGCRLRKFIRKDKKKEGIPPKSKSSMSILSMKFRRQLAQARKEGKKVVPRSYKPPALKLVKKKVQFRPQKKKVTMEKKVKVAAIEVETTSTALQTPASQRIVTDVTQLEPNWSSLINDLSSQVSRVACSQESVTSPATLLQTFKDFKSSHDETVGLFSHGLREGKYKDAPFLHLLIRQVALPQHKQDKILQTIAYDLIKNLDRWVLFKPNSPSDIKEGVQVKIYPPWREFPISTPEGIENSVILNTECYKLCGMREIINLNDSRVQEIMARPVPVATAWDIPVKEPLFMDLVPYRLKNKRTLEYHLRFLTDALVNLDVLLLHAWPVLNPALFLIKDSDETMSFLEVPQGEEVVDVLANGGGKYFGLDGIGVRLKDRISQKLAPFSVMEHFRRAEVTKQNTFFTLRYMSRQSSCTPIPHLDIPQAPTFDNLKTILEVQSVDRNHDQRVSLRCCVLEKKSGRILVVDPEESDDRVRIEFVGDPNYKMSPCASPVGAKLLLRFVRLIFGKVIWDIYTTFEEDFTVDSD